MERESVLDLVSKVTEFNDASVQMADEDLDQALAYVVKLIANPDVPMMKLPHLIVQLQAIAAQCQIKGKYYQVFSTGSDASKRKNFYYTVAAELDKLVAALKYYVK